MMKAAEFQKCVLLLAVVCGGVVAAASRVVAEESPAQVTYQDDVRPIFQQHCFACHSQDDRNSDLALDNYNDVMVGGAGGEVVAGGDADGSRLWMLVTHQDAPEMPPGGDKLPQDQLDVIRTWIDAGLLKDAGSKPKRKKLADVGGFKPSADNRPQGEPAMPESIFREPLVYTSRAGAVDAAAVSPWAPLAAIAGLRQVSLYHTGSGELLGILPYPEGMPRSIRFSRNGSLLLVGGGWPAQLGNAALYDVKTGARLAVVGEETDEVLAADISPDHSLVALGGPKKVVRVYRVADGSLAYEIRKHTQWITALQFSPDGALLATADRGGGLYLWDAPTGNERGELRGHSELVTEVSWRADSKALASASEDDTVRLWQVDGKQIKSWGAHGGGTLSVDFAADGTLATAGRDRLVKLWTVDGKHIKDLVQLDDVALIARVAHDGKLVLGSDWTGRAQLFDAATGEPQSVLPANPLTLQMRVAAAAARLEKTEIAKQEADERLQDLTAQFTQAESAVGNFQQRREEAAQAAEQLNQQRVEAAAQLASLTESWRAAVETAANRATQFSAKHEAMTDARSKLKLLQAAAALDDEVADGKSSAEVQQQEKVVAQAVADVARLRQQTQTAEQAASDLKQQIHGAEETAESAATGYAEAEHALRELDEQAGALPSAAALEQQLSAATDESTAATAAHAETLAHWESAAAEQEALHQAAKTLAAEREARRNEMENLASLASRSQSEQVQLLAELEQRKQAADSVAAQIEQLREKLKAKRAAERELRLAAQQHADQLQELQSRVAGAAESAALVEAKIQQHADAQVIRAKYAEESGEPQAALSRASDSP